MKFQTTCIHGDGPNDATGAVSPAIYCTSTFSHPHVGESTGFNYTRESNPTHARLEKVMSALESGVDSLAFSSGMAAIDAVMRLFVSGDHILTGFDLYGGSFRLFRSVYEPYGLTFSAVHTSDLEAVERAITPKTKAIYLETPTNPTMEITDLRALQNLPTKRVFWSSLTIRSSPHISNVLWNLAAILSCTAGRSTWPVTTISSQAL